MRRIALVAGITGIGGSHVARELLQQGWDVAGLSRGAPRDLPDVRHISADLQDRSALLERFSLPLDYVRLVARAHIARIAPVSKIATVALASPIRTETIAPATVTAITRGLRGVEKWKAR